ncbi:hypothetical protein Val02_11360 [Virgisporangium aliadipatigenens]|uniref:Carrier domain-containing protein n=1 Tax=Virgisporangium aliadipatigenens TaxID=741659 RepID=A0A8J3YHU4_9ACTN|nr:non-ribosomal peptide synthetase [Virgisporangium aliadipatigenens]GIJ44250.1 hypothetical protein Val02_11360 [Virgisporangium aliadipatigenens]
MTSDVDTEMLRDALIDRLLAAEGFGTDEPVAGPADGTDRLPLSSGQQQLWFLDRLEPESSTYNTLTALRLRGQLDVAAMTASFRTIVERHDVFRATFPEVGGVPVQHLGAVPERVATVVDLSGEPEPEAAAARLVDRTAARPFDLASGPLYRFTVARLSEHDHVVIIAVHHIIYDAASRSNLLRELKAHYEANLRRQSAVVPRLPMQYQDYARGQQDRRWDGQLAYWREKLADAPPVLALPADRPRPATRTGRGGVVRFDLGARMTDAIRRLSVSAAVTTYVTLLTSFLVLLSRYSRQRDLVVGSVAYNRPDERLEDLIGFFANAVPLRADLSGDPDFRALLHRVRQMVLEAVANHEVPFEAVVKAVAPERDPSFSPIFQVMFTALNDDDFLDDPEFTGLATELMQVERTTSMFDLCLDVRSSAGVLHGELEYNADLFDRATAERMVAHWRQLLTELLSEPDRPVSGAEILTAPEQQQILVEWNRTGAEVPEPHLLHELFHAQALRSPDAVAVVHGAQRPTYRELEERANRLAHVLRGRGVTTETRVGICLERSPEAVTALLAVLKAGGCFIGLDTTYPPERLGYMLRDARVDVLLTDSLIGADIASDGIVKLFVDTVESELRQQPATPPPTELTPANLVCMIYTSGSTGLPKCAMLSHENFANYFQHFERGFAFSTTVRAHLQMASLAFDLFIADVMRALFTGATLVIGHRDELLSPPHLYALMRREGVNSAEFIPALLKALLDHVEEVDGSLDFMDILAVGGDGWYIEDYLRARRLAKPSTRLIDTYGLTEAAIDNAQYCGADPAQARGGLVPIGRPIANTELYILDPHMRPLPVGVPGELYIGGVGVGRGYFARPGLTASRFVPDPFSGRPGARLYRTGDLTKFRADGVIEIVGRTDHQVKIRGFRIELGEIEAALRSHPEVDHAAVVVQETETGDRRLVGYFTTAATPGEGTGEPDGSRVLAAALREHLAGRLPAHMVPNHLLAIDAIPLNSNGKLDRGSLPDPAGIVAEGPVQRPRDPVEGIVAAIWSEVLKLADVSADANFFTLGGHSLLATQVVSRVRDALRVELPVRYIFEYPTVEGLAGRIDELRAGADGGNVPVPVVPLARDGVEHFDVSFGQQRLWLLQRLDPEDPTYNVPVGFRLHGELDVAALAAAFAGVVRRHEVLRTRLVEIDGLPRQVIGPPRRWDLPVVDLSGSEPAERAARLETLSTTDERTVTDLATGPLLRTTLVRLDKNDHVLLLTFHHAVTDGWSDGILMEDLAAGYAAAVAGREVDLPPLPVQYADFAVWQRGALREDVRRRNLAYWTRRLADPPELLSGVFDRPRPMRSTRRGGRVSFEITPSCHRRLNALAGACGATLYMVLLAAFKTVLSRWTRQTDIVVGALQGHRPTAELEKLIGFFVNTVVLRTDLSGGPSFRAVVDQVRERTLEAYAHQELPFEQVVEALRLDRSTAHQQIFQVMFDLRGVDETFDLAGLRVERYVRGGTIAHFDLVLDVTDGPRGLAGTISYDTDLFTETTVARLAERFVRALDDVASAPDRPIGDIDLYGLDARAVLASSAGETVDAQGQNVQRLVAAQVRARPDAPAVEAADGVLTYAELDERSVRLATTLGRLGIGVEDRVAVCVGPSTDRIVAVLAVLRAGGTLILLDPRQPETERTYQLVHGGTALLVTDGSTRDAFANYPGRRLFLDDRDPSAEAALHPDVAPHPHNAACLTYTSGSTGRPKGIVLTHEGLAAHVLGMSTRLPLHPTDRVLQCHSLGFDAVLEEMLCPLIAGATVVVTDAPLERGYQDFMRLIRRTRTTVVDLPTAFWEGWVTAGSVAEMTDSTLRRVVIGGEAVRRSAVAAWKLQVREAVELVNAYGPAEATVTVTAYTAGPEWRTETAVSVPIGTPVPNARAYLLDSGLHPVPEGVVAELYVSRPGLARGYHAMPARTAAAFVPDPFSEEPGSRLYRTGDLCRRRPDGGLEFVGRADRQVKVRGHRVDLGALTDSVRAHPRIEAATVVLRGGNDGDRRLAAYVVSSDPALDGPTLRRWLGDRIAAHLVPTSVVFIDELPLTAAGKVNDAALPDDRAAAPRTGEVIAPRTEAERLVAEVWTGLLTGEVSVEANFFDLGGHSLLATQATTRIETRTGIRVPVRLLMENPTIETYARALTALLERPVPGRSAVDVVPAARERSGGAPLSCAQERLWVLEQFAPGSALYNMPHAFRYRGELNVTAFEKALRDLVERHEILRTVFVLRDGQPHQVVREQMALSVGIEDVRTLDAAGQDTRIRALLDAEAVRGFDLTRGPLAVANALRLGERNFVLTLNFHHIVFDGFSGSVMWRELAALYAGHAEGRTVSLPPLPIQCVDHAVWQREWLRSEECAAQLDHWVRTLEGAPARFRLTGGQMPESADSAGDGVIFAVPDDIVRGLHTLAQSEGATLFMVLLAAFVATLAAQSDRDDIVVGTPIANRRPPETESLIGFFANTLALRMRDTARMTGRDLVRAAREVVLDALSNQDLPFEHLVAALGPDRSSAFHPVFQVMLTLDTDDEGPTRWPGARLETMRVFSRTAKFDHLLAMRFVGGMLRGRWGYRTAVVPRHRAEALVADLNRVLAALVQAPDTAPGAP